MCSFTMSSAETTSSSTKTASAISDAALWNTVADKIQAVASTAANITLPPTFPSSLQAMVTDDLNALRVYLQGLGLNLPGALLPDNNSNNNNNKESTIRTTKTILPKLFPTSPTNQSRLYVWTTSSGSSCGECDFGRCGTTRYYLQFGTAF